jgi:hypothetical protein
MTLKTFLNDPHLVRVRPVPATTNVIDGEDLDW